MDQWSQIVLHTYLKICLWLNFQIHNYMTFTARVNFYSKSYFYFSFQLTCISIIMSWNSCTATTRQKFRSIRSKLAKWSEFEDVLFINNFLSILSVIESLYSSALRNFQFAFQSNLYMYFTSHWDWIYFLQIGLSTANSCQGGLCRKQTGVR